MISVLSSWAKSSCFATTQTTADAAATVIAIASATSSVRRVRKLISFRLRRAYGSWLFAQRVPDAANGVQQPRLAALFELPPQVADVDPERVRGRAEVVAPHALVDLRARQHLTGVAHEELEEVELGACQLQAALAAVRLARRRVDEHVGEAERSVARPGASQQRAHAGTQLLDRERLDEIVVGAGVEAFDAVVDGVARRDDEDRHGIVATAQRAAHLDPADLRHQQ